LLAPRNNKKNQRNNQQPPPVQTPGIIKAPIALKAWRKRPSTPRNKPRGKKSQLNL
jgi:hypothetical protein